jgi:glycosyltransferase involved in cell wall biosynthesis
MLKVAMITPQWLNTKGGPTNYVNNLKIILENRSHKVCIVTSDRYPNVFIFSNYLFIRELQIVKILMSFTPDVIHIHGRLHYILPAVLYKKLYNESVKIIFTFHTQPRCKKYLNESEKVEIPYKGIQAKVGQFLLGFCNNITSVSKSLVEAINKNCDLKILNFKVIHAGAIITDGDEVDSDNQFRRYSLQDASTILSSIGVLSWDWKVAGHKIAIEAISLLKDRFPNIKLLIAGDGPYKQYLQDVAANLGVVKNIIFCGNVEKSATILRITDIYVHMALNEALGLVIIEAMQSRKAIIAAHLGGIPELIVNNETGVLIEPSAQNLANTLIELIEDKNKRESMGNNAYLYASQELTWQKITDEYLLLYTEGNVL